MKQLEKALEDAAKERQEILEAAEKEIEYHRSIAAELEQTMIDDFEWKLHEIEADYNRKLRESGGGAGAVAAIGAGNGSVDGDAFERRLREAKNEIMRQKDEELAKMHVQIRKEMEDKLRMERNNLKAALDAAHSDDKEKAVMAAKKELDRGAKNLERRLQDERDQLSKEIEKVKGDFERLERAKVDAVNEAVRLGDQKVSKSVQGFFQCTFMTTFDLI